MTWAGFIRIAAFLALVAIFVADYGFALFAKEIGTEIYAFIAALALGVDGKWLMMRGRELFHRAEAPPDRGEEDRR